MRALGPIRALPGVRVWHATGKALQVSDGQTIVDVAVSSSCGGGTAYEMIKGQTAPRIHGWASVAHRERHARWALGVACEAKTATFTARFSLPGERHPTAAEQGSGSGDTTSLEPD